MLTMLEVGQGIVGEPLGGVEGGDVSPGASAGLSVTTLAVTQCCSFGGQGAQPAEL